MEQMLKNALLSYHVHVAMSGSQYWTIDGVAYRVSDHSKPSKESGYEEGYNDFRNFNDFIRVLSDDVDLSDKTSFKEIYAKKAEQYIKRKGVWFDSPIGLYDDIENAKSGMFNNAYIIETGNKKIDYYIKLKNYNNALDKAYYDSNIENIEKYKKLLSELKTSK